MLQRHVLPPERESCWARVPAVKWRDDVAAVRAHVLAARAWYTVGQLLALWAAQDELYIV
jgi:hypothetical protein